MAAQASQKKAVALTGVSGFVGSHLAKRLLDDGWEVHAWVRKPLPGRAPLLPADVARIIVHETGTTPEQRYDSFLKVFQKYEISSVIHLATHFVGVHQVNDLPALSDSNLLFGMQLLEAMHRAQSKARFVMAGTAWQHFESAAYDPVSLYAATKQAFEDVLKYYQNVCGFKAVILKLFDSYGPHDYRGKLFDGLRKAAHEGRSLDFSAGEQWIDLIYIDDVTRAFVAALDSKVPEGTYAVSSGQPIRLRELIPIYQKILGRHLNVNFGARPYRPREMMNPWKIGPNLPGWSPQVPLQEGIRLMEGNG